MIKVISLKGGRSLIAGFSKAKLRSRQWLVFLSESGSDFRYGNREELKALVGTRVARKLNFLVVNKPGVEPGRTDRIVFENSFRRQTRIIDIVSALAAVVPKGDRIFLVGYSEGAYLAPQVACLDSRIRAIMMIGGGTRGWLKEELSTASRREKVIFQKQIKEIYKNPKSLRRWNGFSYATWYSYRGDNTLQALKDLRVPTIAILGARDRVIDLKTTIVDLMLVSEKQSIQLHVFGDCGHYFEKHWSAVSRVLGRFLADQMGMHS